MGSNPSYFKGASLPVEHVSWNDIAGAGGFLERAYRVAAAEARLAAGARFSLPTEAQWEFACRAGTTTALNNGKSLTSTNGACRNLDEVGWYLENSDRKTHPGGLKKANAWGLHEMHGNLFEWCADWKGDYPTCSMSDPLGPNSGSYRVLRGGGCNVSASGCRAAYRYYGYHPGYASGDVGFRVALSSVP
jgi:formylglycine-generating enzyme required for sulfatase activity